MANLYWGLAIFIKDRRVISLVCQKVVVINLGILNKMYCMAAHSRNISGDANQHDRDIGVWAATARQQTIGEE
jgi:hypothetical protein